MRIENLVVSQGKRKLFSLLLPKDSFIFLLGELHDIDKNNVIGILSSKAIPKP